MAANISRIIIVSAVLPKLSLNITDRYLLSETAEIPCGNCFKKRILLDEKER